MGGGLSAFSWGLPPFARSWCSSYGGDPLSSGSLSLAEVARDLDGETRSWLRHECGGLQTLLRNFHQVFVGACAGLVLRVGVGGQLCTSE